MQRVNNKKADQATVRRLNMSAILKLLRDRGTLARADLAKELGMTRNTASNIVTELVQSGIVVETEFRREGAGRPGLLLELATTGGFSIGAEIDINRIIVIAVDFKGNKLWEESARTLPSQSQKEIITKTEKLVEHALEWGIDENLKALGIGLGLAGLVDAEAGTLTYAPTLNWKDIPFKDLWEKKFGLTVHIDNEANSAALGYYAYADRFTARNLVYLSIGAGMAAGLILEGQVFRGSGGFAGQAGHMKIRPNGEACSCGDHGCWVTEVGLPALIRKTGQADIDLEEVTRRLNHKDESLQIIVNEMAEMLGLGIINLVHIFNLDRVILGGALRPILPFMLERVRAVVDERALKHPRANVKIKISDRDDDSVFGAAYLVLEAILSDPVPLVRSLI
jgi:predicted NBD/HSP70 family sugar kinase